MTMALSFGPFELDPAAFELRRDGKPTAVEPQVFELIVLLVQNRDRVVTKDELIDRIWSGRIVSEATISSRIKAARQALGDDGSAQSLIKTIHGRGFRFLGDVKLESLPTDGGASSTGRGAMGRQSVRYCRADDSTMLAYAISGRGAPLIKAPNWLSHLEFEWQSPVWGHWWRELSRHNLLIRFDQRGVGLSDWNVSDLSFEAFVSDLEAVTEATGFRRFVLLGVSQGCATCIAYAARHPERVAAMVLYGGYAAGWRARGDEREIARRLAMVELMRTGWGLENAAFRQLFTSLFVPNASPEQMQWFNDLARITTSPENAVRLSQSFSQIDVRHLLRQVRVPTLILHQSGDAVVPMWAGRLLATGIPGARIVALDGSNHILLENEASWPRFLSEVKEFLDEFSPGDAGG